MWKDKKLFNRDSGGFILLNQIYIKYNINTFFSKTIKENRVHEERYIDLSKKRE